MWFVVDWRCSRPAVITFRELTGIHDKASDPLHRPIRLYPLAVNDFVQSIQDLPSGSREAVHESTRKSRHVKVLISVSQHAPRGTQSGTAPHSPSLTPSCNALPLTVADYPMHPADASARKLITSLTTSYRHNSLGMSVLASVCYIS